MVKSFNITKVANASTVSILENRTATNSVIPLTTLTQSSQVGKWAHSVRWPSCGPISQINFTQTQYCVTFTQIGVPKAQYFSTCATTEIESKYRGLFA